MDLRGICKSRKTFWAREMAQLLRALVCCSSGGPELGDLSMDFQNLNKIWMPRSGVDENIVASTVRTLEVHAPAIVGL